MTQVARKLPAPADAAPLARHRPPLFAHYLAAEPIPAPRPLRLRLSQALGTLALAGLFIAGAALLWCA